MLYIKGQSLQGLIDSGKRFTPREIMDLFRPLCDCLDYAHAQGIIHRDIKPANILIDRAGKPYLAEEMLKLNPTHSAVQDYLARAKKELIAAQVAPILRSGMASYANANYSQCVQEMEKVLKLDKDNKEAQKYLFLADSALARKDILQTLELFKAAGRPGLTFLIC